MTENLQLIFQIIQWFGSLFGLIGGIIEEHGGSIVPLSEPGKGTAMVVYLPRYQSPF